MTKLVFPTEQALRVWVLDIQRISDSPEDFQNRLAEITETTEIRVMDVEEEYSSSELLDLV